MLVIKPAQNFGYRSWRYAMVINDMELEKIFIEEGKNQMGLDDDCLLYTSPSPRDGLLYRMPSSA